MKPSEAQFLNEMIEMIKKSRAAGESPRQFLFQNGAINSAGVILSNYPMLEVRKSSGDTDVVDCGGHMPTLLGRQSEFERQNITARIAYYPHFYSYYTLALETMNVSGRG